MKKKNNNNDHIYINNTNDHKYTNNNKYKSKSRLICESQFLTEDGIKDIFNEIDKEEDGFLSRSEVQEVLLELNLHLSDKELEKLFSHLSSGGNKNLISLEQFSTFVHHRQIRLADVFCELDTSGDGVLEQNELLLALQRIGINPSSEQVQLLIKQLDVNNDGYIEFSEFRRFFLLIHEINVRNVFDIWRQCIDSGIDKGDSYTLPTDRTDPAWKIILAGAIAGAISRTSTAPLDRIKMLLQAEGQIKGQKVTGILSGLQSIYYDGGFKAYFRGNGTNVLKIAPESAVKFFAYERLKYVISKDPANLTGIERFIAGSMAGVIAQTTIYPLEVTKTRLAVAKTGTYNGIVDCIYKVYSREGTRTLFRGLGASLSGIIPYAGVDLSVFFTLKETWMKQNPDKTPGILILLGMGATSSFCGQITAYPLQLVRTRLQAQGLPGAQTYNGMFDCFTHVYKTQGLRGFYTGITPNLMKGIPAISISYVVYEKARQILKT